MLRQHVQSVIWYSVLWNDGDDWMKVLRTGRIPNDASIFLSLLTK